MSRVNRFSTKVLFLVLFLVLLISSTCIYGSEQEPRTCRCRLESQCLCATAIPDPYRPQGFCIIDSHLCTPCVCDSAGGFTCPLETMSYLLFNGSDSYGGRLCSYMDVSTPVCPEIPSRSLTPSSSPSPTLSPTPYYPVASPSASMNPLPPTWCIAHTGYRRKFNISFIPQPVGSQSYDTWTYRVMEENRDLSYWFIEIPMCLMANNVIAVSPILGSEIGYNPKIDTQGVKWEVSDAFVQGTFMFKLGQAVPVGTVRVCTKSGPGSDCCVLSGPDC